MLRGVIPTQFDSALLAERGFPRKKFRQALALLLQQTYSSYWGHMKVLGILIHMAREFLTLIRRATFSPFETKYRALIYYVS